MNGPSPDYIDAPSQSSIPFLSHGTGGETRSWIVLSSSKNALMPEKELYEDISKNLPAWAYLYMAPDRVKLENGVTVHKS